ncbi:MAG: serpin family protein [Ruminococcus sp.]|nr:serpin family protein [Ruminococcus sp.]
MNKTGSKKMLSAALAAVMMALTACGQTGESKEGKGTAAPSAEPAPAQVNVQPLSNAQLLQPDTEPDQDFYNKAADFSVELLKRSAGEDIARGDNAMISAESVIYAMEMAANGAGGNTLDQIQNTLLGGIDIETADKYLLYLRAAAEGNEDIRFHIANSFWVREGRLEPAEGYAELLRSYFGADMYLAPFDQGTCDDVNAWISENTDGMIPHMIDNIGPEDVAFLINAMAFEAEWQNEYWDDDIEEGRKFYNAEGGEDDCTMLYSCEPVYFSDGQAEGFAKNYKGGDYAFVAIRPNDGVELSDYLDGFTGEHFMEMYRGADRDAEVYVEMPEFKSEYDVSLAPTLIDMGITDAFEDIADFTGMGRTMTGILKIDRVLHKSYIEVSREGTKAAAATVVEMTDAAMAMEEEPPHYITLDKPFIYAIVDTESGFPIFMGVTNTVGE